MLPGKICVTTMMVVGMAMGTIGWKVYVDEMLREYHKYWKTLVNDLKLDPFSLGNHKTEIFGKDVELMGGTLYGMSNVHLPAGHNFCGELQYPLKLSGVLEFPQLFAHYKEVDVGIGVGQYNASIPDVVVKIEATVDPLVSQDINIDVTEIKHGEIKFDGNFIDTVANFFLGMGFQTILKNTISSIVKGVTASALQEKQNDLSGAVSLLSPMAASELLKHFEVAVACDLFDDESGSPCNLHVIKWKGDKK